ncbi:MAG: hypothetical protein DWQ44_01760 [Bacteroidetes bacterium]|nr:MAG: hypothetical protein DWQ33_05490 [Bacteroidota bacterium]REK04706.1 MAG: hypothetical protein DWQ39_05655 [Bacteroidota bacterium]REK36180.1 MAG: hypothetical protein DWQ44_01760 [Bacteroidota bacterium]REK51449.1 MAG: hypothetical protein DWQ48_01075 [Bacteroidota bacterium]
MKMRKSLKLGLLTGMIAISFLSPQNAPAQDYSNGIGVRLGGFSHGITYKHKFGGADALELIASTGRRSLILTGLYEYHRPLGNAQGFNWFLGGGAHIGFYNEGYYYYYYRNKNRVYVYEDRMDRRGFGIDFILGLEYKFNNVPITLGLDLKPFVDFHEAAYSYWDGAFTFRFTF